jgi:hypothetical protein
MRKSEFANSIEIIIIIMLFFSIIALMLNSFLPTVIINNPDKPIFFNLESMQYSQNIEIKNLYNDFIIINNLLWVFIICTFIAFYGVILNISNYFRKISYLFLFVGCPTIIISSILCYLFISLNLKIVNSDELLLAYAIVEPIRYSYIIFILLIAIILSSILYNISILPLIFKGFRLKKQNLTLEKTFKKPIEQINITLDKKKDRKVDFYFKRKNESNSNWFSNDFKKIIINEELDKSFIKKEKKDMELNSNINIKFTNDKKTPFSNAINKEKSKHIKSEKNEVEVSKSLEKALFSAVDKVKKKR